jgi:hypothetical protein
LRDIIDSISRKKGNFVVAHTPTDDVAFAKNPFTIAVGSYVAVRAGGGFIISVGLSREKLTKLRDWCNELLGERE